MATKTVTREYSFRPPFDIDKFVADYDGLIQKHQPKKGGAKVLDLLGINSTIISLGGESMYGVVTNLKSKRKRKLIPYEAALSSYSTHFLQNDADLTKPEMIKDFALFFRRTVKDHAVRFVVDDGVKKKIYINASLGEFSKSLYELSRAKLKFKRSMIVTAFHTRSCLTSNTNDDPINHIVDDNHTIEYQSDVILRNALQCTNNTLMSLSWLRKFIPKHFIRGDVHVRGGTVANGNDFSIFQEEVNDDKPLADFCADFHNALKLDEPIVLNEHEKKVTHCQPILIDIIMGTLNFSLFSAFLLAHGLTPIIFLASFRCKIIFQPNGEGEGEYKLGLRDDSEVAKIAQGTHPNSVKQHLSLRLPKEIKQLDEGISEVLKPLNGLPIKVMGDDGKERDAFFNWSPSDFFQRLYILRLSGDIQLKDIDYKRLKEVKEELKATQEEHKAKTEELEVKTEELEEAEVQLKVKEATAKKLTKEAKVQERARKRAKEEQEEAERRAKNNQALVQKRAKEKEEAAKAGDLLFKHCGKK